MDTKSSYALVEEVVVSKIDMRRADLFAQAVLATALGRRTLLLGSLMLITFLAGCQTQPSIAPTRDASSPASQSGSLPRPAEVPAEGEQRSLPASPKPNESISAVSALVMEAEGYLQQQQWQRAIVTAEHGLRIDRRYAPFYRVLAEGYRALGDYAQAEQFARQGLRFCQAECAQLSRLADSLSQN